VRPGRMRAPFLEEESFGKEHLKGHAVFPLPGEERLPSRWKETTSEDRGYERGE